MASGETESDFSRKIDKFVVKARANKEWEVEYMTLLQRDRENIEKGRQEEKKASALNAINEGLPKDVIQRIFGISDSEYAGILEMSESGK